MFGGSKNRNLTRKMINIELEITTVRERLQRQKRITERIIIIKNTNHNKAAVYRHKRGRSVNITKLHHEKR